jgi:hypothetical protein
MKIVGSFMILLLGILNFSFAQEKSLSFISFKNDSTHFEEKSNYIHLKDPESINQLFSDSLLSNLQLNIFSERKLAFSQPQELEHDILVFKLPDPQSRMPIKEFDKSVNYTIQIKKID